MVGTGGVPTNLVMIWAAESKPANAPMISVTMRAETIPTEFEVLDERLPTSRATITSSASTSGAAGRRARCTCLPGRYLLFSDIPNDRILRWDETTGAVGVFRQPAGYANGNTLDRQGRLVSCEHGNRRVTRTEHDGSITVLADRYDGKRLNSPNDVVVRSDGSIWFTDPAYGIDSDYEGHRPRARSAAATSTASIRATGIVRHRRRRLRCAPTGSPSRSTSPSCTSPTRRAEHIRLFDVRRRQARRRARLRRPARTARSTGFGSTTPAGCGPPPATASTASTPTAR